MIKTLAHPARKAARPKDGSGVHSPLEASASSCTVIVPPRRPTLGMAAYDSPELSSDQRDRQGEHAADPGNARADAGDRSATPQNTRTGTSMGTLSTDDLEAVLESFSKVTERLHASHQALQQEVQRLNHELHEANEQLRRSRDLAALGHLAAGIAHEIRNPLAGIRLYAAALVEDLTQMPDSRSLAGKIVDAVGHLDGIVHDVLSFSREIRLRSDQVDARQIAEEALDACTPLADQSRITAKVIVELPGARTTGASVRRSRILPPSSRCSINFQADHSLLLQALTNVVRNAVEALDARGEIIIRIQRSAVTLPGPSLDDFGPSHAAENNPLMRDLKAPAVCFTVEDSGTGIDPSIASRLFNPFFTTRHTGTGLGLPIVHRIIDAHRGRIEITRSSVLGGAAVRLILPLTPREGDGAGAQDTQER